MRRPWHVAAATATALTLLAACAAPAPATTPEAGADVWHGRLVVLAASSLTDVLTDLEERLEAEHPGLDVRTGFAASPTLVAQVLGGAPADVLVTASTSGAAEVAERLGGDPVVVALNRLVLAVPAGNPAGVRSLDDLADPGLVVALCAPQVPCGALGEEMLGRAGVVPAPDTLEPDVRAVLTRLRTGEADAGLVYLTDVATAGGDVEGIEVPAAVQARTEYPALVLPDAAQAAAAAAYVELLRGPTGRTLLGEAGFELP